MNRRQFLKVTGGGIAAILVRPPSLVDTRGPTLVDQGREYVVNVSVHGIEPGSRIYVAAAESGEVLYEGLAKDTVESFTTVYEKDREVKVRIRKAGWCPMEIRPVINSDGLDLHVRQLQDLHYV